LDALPIYRQASSLCLAKDKKQVAPTGAASGPELVPTFIDLGNNA